MEKRSFFSLSFVLLIFVIHGFQKGEYRTGNDVSFTQYTDSTDLPECIKKLNGPATKSVRSSLGARQYRKTHTLKNGKKVYAFSVQPSIGCNINEPASTKYYNDSCRMIASFPANFSIKKAFKPFVAKGYTPDDFPEAALGDYPAYFAKLEETTASKNPVNNDPKPKDPFPVEKEFKISLAEDDVLNFKKGDIIRISTKNGLTHYRNNTLLNTYKLIPQLTTIMIEAQCKVPPCFSRETKVLVYFMDHAERFIDVRNNTLMISASIHKDANTPTKDIKLSWKKAYGLSAK